MSKQYNLTSSGTLWAIGQYRDRPNLWTFGRAVWKLAIFGVKARREYRKQREVRGW